MLRTARVRLALPAVVALAACAVAAPSAGAATITACVKSKTGDVRIRTGAAAKKKCPKGWKKVRWNVSGPAGLPGTPGVPGSAGATGSPPSIKDASGAVVGQFLGLIPTGFPVYALLRDGGIYWYLGSGEVYPLASPDWKTNDCSGQAYMKDKTFTQTTFGLLVGGPFRLTFRTMAAGVFGPTSAWKGTGTVEPIAAVQLYRRDSATGACQADGSPYTGNLALLDAVTAPPDAPGPLTIG